jgi:serine/threonine-protein kinase
VKKGRKADDTLVDLSPEGVKALPREGHERVSTGVPGERGRHHCVGSAVRTTPVEIGSSIAGRFRLDALLGEGGMGAVFDGIDAQTGEAVAIKVLHDRYAMQDDYVARFLHEARVMRRIKHDGIPRVIDAGKDERKRAYIALERFEGRDLHDALDEGPLDAKDVVEVGHQLLSVLAAVHAHGIIHRDVKPENIFLAFEGEDLKVKLLDFGIAKVRGDVMDPDAVRTHDGVRLGTPHYMSPEQWRGEALTERSDVWAAGAVLYTAIMGDPPYDSEDLGELMDMVTKREAPSLAKLHPQMGPAFTDTIDRALRNDPRGRWANARAMAAALHEGGIRVDALDWDE